MKNPNQLYEYEKMEGIGKKAATPVLYKSGPHTSAQTPKSRSDQKTGLPLQFAKSPKSNFTSQ